MRETKSSVASTRRGFLNVCGAAFVAGATGLGCDVLSTDPDTGRDDDRAARTDDAEAPMLAERVASGDLPPVSERLPKSPVVLEPNDRLGVYGGTWRASMIGPTELTWLVRTVGYDFLMRWRQDTVSYSLDDVIPNVAEEYEVRNDGAEYVFHLREGMKWSDGEPFTADDIVFAVEDVVLNENIFPVPPSGILGGGEPGVVEKIDDYTVRFIFDTPHGLFPHILASRIGNMRILVERPRHYLEQFHADYNSDIDTVVEREGAPDWVELFSQKQDIWANPDLPRLHAWIPEDSVDAENRISFVRNPYYWKVDSDGRQLPYLDQVVFEYLDREVMVVKALQGEIDMQDRTVNTLQNKPILARDRKEGNYRFNELRPGNSNVAIIFLNQTHQDPVKREIFQNRNFRVGLSHAINRNEIIDIVYRSQGEAWQTAPLPWSDFYHEELATSYLEYDTDLANDHLDRAGYSERNSDGIRLGPDGSPISFLLEFWTRDYGFDWADVGEMLQSYWRKVGIDVEVEARGQSFVSERTSGNLHDAVINQADAGGLDPHLVPRFYFPHNLQAWYGVTWAEWYRSGGASGEEPPERVQEQMALYDRLTQTVDPDEHVDIMRQILDITNDEFYSIGICYLNERYALVRNDFHNVPENYLDAASYSNPGPTNPPQYFTERA